MSAIVSETRLEHLYALIHVVIRYELPFVLREQHQQRFIQQLPMTFIFRFCEIEYRLSSCYQQSYRRHACQHERPDCISQAILMSKLELQIISCGLAVGLYEKWIKKYIDVWMWLRIEFTEELWVSR
jgi:hypothetical protein